MRDVLIIGIACVATIFLGAWLYFSGVDTLRAPAPIGGTAFIVLDQGTSSGSLTERKNYRIKNADELNELWYMVHGTGAPTTIDFQTKEIIAVFDGTHTTGGYGIYVTSVNDTASANRMISITHIEPGQSCATSDAITSPFQIIVLPKSDAPLVRDEKTVVSDCD